LWSLESCRDPCFRAWSCDWLRRRNLICILNSRPMLLYMSPRNRKHGLVCDRKLVGCAQTSMIPLGWIQQAFHPLSTSTPHLSFFIFFHHHITTTTHFKSWSKFTALNHLRDSESIVSKSSSYQQASYRRSTNVIPYFWDQRWEFQPCSEYGNFVYAAELGFLCLTGVALEWLSNLFKVTFFGFVSNEYSPWDETWPMNGTAWRQAEKKRIHKAFCLETWIKSWISVSITLSSWKLQNDGLSNPPSLRHQY
jgi:hypothetical protein